MTHHVSDLRTQDAQPAADDMVAQLRAAATQLGTVQVTASAYDPGFLKSNVRHYNNIRSGVTFTITLLVAVAAVVAFAAVCTERLRFISA